MKTNYNPVNTNQGSTLCPQYNDRVVLGLCPRTVKLGVGVGGLRLHKGIHRGRDENGKMPTRFRT
ncbi:hypothetical protein [Echinicola rosea]|uniref:hypothetical protein n=1 Tax=Echinicola rosea TaxID=1807691 RepID=UPI0010CA8FC4|nr:hypothetical protein [Echinicola rosea]